MDLRWDPFEEIANLRARVKRAFEQHLRFAPQVGEAADSGEWAPRVDIYETDTSLVFEAELPGLRRDDIEVEAKGDTLVIKGTRLPVSGREYLRMERPRGPFHRSFVIGGRIDPSRVRAEYRDGVLAVTVPKPQPPQSHQVKVPIE